MRVIHAACCVLIAIAFAASINLAADELPPGVTRTKEKGIWNPLPKAIDNQPQIVKVLVLNYDPIVPAEGHRPLSEVFKWTNAVKLAAEYKEVMERASGGYLQFEIVEWRNLNELYAQEDGQKYTIDEYVRNRRAGKGWREKAGVADYPRLLREQAVPPMIDRGEVDEVWIFSDHFFGLWEASMAGPRSFFINGGVYPKVPTRRPFAFYGFNYERATAEMAHNTAHRTESTLNRIYGKWNLKKPATNWDRFSANFEQSDGVAGVGTCHYPPNAKKDYDYSNPRKVLSWADEFLTYPKLMGERKQITSDAWHDGDHHRGYMRWYFAHLPRAPGVNDDGRQNNWWKYLYDFDNYEADGKAKPPSATLLAGDRFEKGGDVHNLMVAYSSPLAIDVASLDHDDLEVLSPSGKKVPAKRVLVSDHRDGTRRVATYQIFPPIGKWTTDDEGVYSVRLAPGQVKLAGGGTFAAMDLGTFEIGAKLKAIDADRPPVLVLQPDTASLSAGQHLAPQLTVKYAAKEETLRAARHVAWNSSNPRVAVVSRDGLVSAENAGKTTIIARLGELTASLELTVEGEDLLSGDGLTASSDIPREGDKPVTVIAAYPAKCDIDPGSLDRYDIEVSGPDGFHQFARFLREKRTAMHLEAHYAIDPPEGGWEKAPSGVYSVTQTSWQVRSREGRYVTGFSTTLNRP